MSESVASEVASAMVGGMFSASALYPLEVLKTRMQAETKLEDGGDDEGRGGGKSDEEPTGCQRPCVGRRGRSLREAPPDEREGEREEEDGVDEESADSATATLISIDPAEGRAELERLALRREYAAAASAGMGSYASLMYRKEGGAAPFYSGVVTSAVQSATEKALYFFAYTFLKNGYVGITGNPNIGTVSNLILGCFAEWAHLPVTLPIDCVTTAIQTDDKNRGAFALLANILSEKGVGGFYKGIEAYTVLCLKPAIQYTVYEQVKKIVLVARRADARAAGRAMGGDAKDDSLNAAEAFFLGMFARIVATMLTYPYLRAKVMLQSTYKNAVVKPTISQMIAEQLKAGGVWGLYQGIGPELTRGVFSAALMMMVKERIGVIVRALIDGRSDDNNRIEAQQRK